MSEQYGKGYSYWALTRSKASVSQLVKDGTAWMSQAQIAELFASTKQNISLHIQNIFEEGELEQNSVVKEYLTTDNDGKNYSVAHYSLEMILAIGFRVRSKRGTQFRQWANKNLSEYMIKGFVMDDERLKNPDGKPEQTSHSLLEQIKNLIEQTKNNVAVAINSSMTMMYWEIGNKINQDILNNQKTDEHNKFLEVNFL